jgi:membrane protease subunit (stomatin/prohibitin family)
MMRDADFGIVRLRAYGTYDFRIVDVKKFLKEVAGTDDTSASTNSTTRCARALSACSRRRWPARRFPRSTWPRGMANWASALLPLINPAIGAKYGLEMTTFLVENVSVPPEVEQAIDKRSSMAAVGNLNDYVKFQMAQGLGQPAAVAASAAPARNSRWAWPWRSK